MPRSEMRDAVPGPDGSFWLLTNNTDRCGALTVADDKLVKVLRDVSRTG